jgi:hypothetical protein
MNRVGDLGERTGGGRDRAEIFLYLLLAGPEYFSIVFVWDLQVRSMSCHIPGMQQRTRANGCSRSNSTSAFTRLLLMANKVKNIVA